MGNRPWNKHQMQGYLCIKVVENHSSESHGKHRFPGNLGQNAKKLRQKSHFLLDMNFWVWKDYIQIHYACNEGKKKVCLGLILAPFAWAWATYSKVFSLVRTEEEDSSSFFLMFFMPVLSTFRSPWMGPLALIKKWGTLRRRPYFDDWFPNFFHSKMLHFWRPLKSISGCRTQHFAVEGKSTTSCWKWISI